MNAQPTDEAATAAASILIRPEFYLMISVIKTFLVVARVDFPGKIGTLFDGRICHSY